MNIIERFKRLKIWGKLGVVGSLASILGLLSAIYALDNSSSFSSISVDNQSSYVGNARDVEIHNNYASVKENDRQLLEEGFESLLPDGIRSKTFRYAETMLGVPIEEYENTRVYEKSGYRVKLFGGNKKSYNSIEYGPLPNGNHSHLPSPKRIAVDFPNTSLGEFTAGLGSCRVSDWNYGANGRCMNYLEIECGGSQADSGLYYRAGVHSCFYQTSHIPNTSIDEIFWFPKVSEDEALGETHILNTKINFVAISTVKRECPRAAGCE
ncbi:hypothetical protein [Pseudomaricurvus sp.]|uniref:hypothetical protein n=1 Tax=Pseudomaricurvus sp. TaxID=2004510 RepID=UPI003F6C6FA2